MKSDVAGLTQILERIERIQGSGVDKARFLTDPWDQDAKIRNFEIIGEATKRLSEATKARAREIRLEEIAGFRDVAIHGYDPLNLGRVWILIEKEIPRLKLTVRRLLVEDETSS